MPPLPPIHVKSEWEKILCKTPRKVCKMVHKKTDLSSPFSLLCSWRCRWCLHCFLFLFCARERAEIYFGGVYFPLSFFFMMIMKKQLYFLCVTSSFILLNNRLLYSLRLSLFRFSFSLSRLIFCTYYSFLKLTKFNRVARFDMCIFILYFCVMLFGKGKLSFFYFTSSSFFAYKYRITKRNFGRVQQESFYAVPLLLLLLLLMLLYIHMTGCLFMWVYFLASCFFFFFFSFCFYFISYIFFQREKKIDDAFKILCMYIRLVGGSWML